MGTGPSQSTVSNLDLKPRKNRESPNSSRGVMAKAITPPPLLDYFSDNLRLVELLDLVITDLNHKKNPMMIIMEFFLLYQNIFFDFILKRLISFQRNHLIHNLNRTIMISCNRQLLITEIKVILNSTISLRKR